VKQVLRYVALLVVGLHAASAQVSTGTITGYVHDSSEAVIVGAKVDIVHSVFRSFALREHVNLQFRAEAFNLTNTPAFFLPSAASPALTIGNASFGKLSSSSATGRQLQFGLKLVF
jgi:hypothetical protein